MSWRFQWCLAILNSVFMWHGCCLHLVSRCLWNQTLPACFFGCSDNTPCFRKNKKYRAAWRFHWCLAILKWSLVWHGCCLHLPSFKADVSMMLFLSDTTVGMGWNLESKQFLSSPFRCSSWHVITFCKVTISNEN